jgi:lysophospholipase L1-like esterase
VAGTVIERVFHSGAWANYSYQIASTFETPTGAAAKIKTEIAQSETWVFEGDSWTAGTAQGNDRETYPYYLATLSHTGISIVNVAVAGTTAETMVSTFAATVAPSLTATTGRLSTCFIFAGINDAATRTTTQLRDDLRSLWTSARNAGARVVAFTLPHRTAASGWSQSNWKIINDQIIADSSYYDVIVRTDVIFSNTSSGEMTDGLHASTSAHRKLASRVLDAIQGRPLLPSLPSDYVCNSVASTTFSANTRKNLAFSELYDSNGDGTTATVGSDANTAVFTAACDGTYEIAGRVCLSGMILADTAYLNAWITPLATGTEVEHRLDFQNAAGANPTLHGVIRRRLLRGDKINLAIVSSRASSTVLTNSNNGEFSVRLVSIP